MRQTGIPETEGKVEFSNFVTKRESARKVAKPDASRTGSAVNLEISIHEYGAEINGL
jgi:hypothetical protein